MGNIKVKQEYIKSCYPEAYEQILNLKQRSKSKSKSTPIDQCEWGCYWCVEIKSSFSMLDFVQKGITREEQEKNDPSYIDVIHARFFATVGRAKWESKEVNGVPSVLLDYLKEG